jgi:LacI family transcriptional regulator
MADFFILQRSDYSVFQRFDVGFATAWRELAPSVRLLVRREISSKLIQDPGCKGLAGGQLYLMTLPRKILEEKILINVSQRFRGDPRGLNLLVDNQKIGKLAAASLLEKGFDSFAVIEESSHEFSRIRSEVFCEAVSLQGKPMVKHVVHFTPNASLLEDEAAQLQDMGTFVNTLTTPTAVFAVNDHMAELFLRAQHSLPGSQPHTHAVLGVDDLFDDPLELIHCPVPLSSIRPPFTEIGKRAAKKVLLGLETGVFPQGDEIVSGARLVERESTRGVSAYDPVVRLATRTISDWMSDGEVPTVSRLAEQCKVSERTLYNRFQSALQESPKSYILNVRLSQACDALRHSDLTITEIALDLGFSSPGALSRQFRKRFEKTPREYREEALTVMQKQ